MSLIKENIYFERIKDLKNQMNRLEMLSEIDKTDLKESAKSLLANRFKDILKDQLTDWLTKYSVDLFRSTANQILSELQLESIDGDTQEDLLERFLDRFD